MGEFMQKIQCGCKKDHIISATDTDTVVYKGETFKPMCALREAVKIAFETQEELRITKFEINKLLESRKKLEALMKKIRTLSCFYCGQSVEKGWKFYGDGIVCKMCQHELKEE
jgi:hypothetical protein